MSLNLCQALLYYKKQTNITNVDKVGGESGLQLEEVQFFTTTAAQTCISLIHAKPLQIFLLSGWGPKYQILSRATLRLNQK